MTDEQYERMVAYGRRQLDEAMQRAHTRRRRTRMCDASATCESAHHLVCCPRRERDER